MKLKVSNFTYAVFSAVLIFSFLLGGSAYAQIPGFSGQASSARSVTFALLGTPLNGSFFYCTNCQATAPCTSGGTGAFAYRVAGVWNCTTGSGGVVPVNTTATTSNWFSAYNSATGVFTKSQPAFTDISGTASSAQIPNNAANTTGNAATATAFAANGTNCVASSFPLGIDASGNSETCTPAVDIATAQTITGAKTFKGPGTAGTAVVNVTDSANRVGVRLNDNGTMILDSDVSSGTTPLSIKYNGGASVASVSFQGVFSGASYSVSTTNGLNLNLGGGNVYVKTNGSPCQIIYKVQDTVTPYNDASWTEGCSAELLTLSTSGTTTDTTANLLPANAIIDAVAYRITTTITTATNFTIGDATTPARFTTTQSTLTAGTTGVGLEAVGTVNAKQTAAAKVRVTTTGTPGAGIIRIVTFWHVFTPPTS